MKRIITLLGILSLLTISLNAQATRGAIAGTVTDSNGAALAGAKLTTINLDTNISRETVSDGSGLYRVPALEPGRYSIKVEQTGFETLQVKEVTVRATQDTTYNPSLKIGNVTISVEVTGSEEGGISLNKTNPTIGLTATNKQAVELPLSAGRNINNLALLSPNTFSAPGSTGISANGQRARNNNFTIDGSDNNDSSVTISTTPVLPEAVAEFQVQTNSYSVEFGRNSGAQLNVITKSGTNQYHGDAWDYYRGSGLNALDNLEKASGITRPARFNRNQIGFDAGGPVIKNRTFIYGLFQRDITNVGDGPGSSVRIITPTGFQALQKVALRSGQSNESRQAVLNSLNFLTDKYKQNPTFSSLKNVNLKDANGNPVAIETGLTNLMIRQPADSWNWLIRGDHKISENDQLTVRYIYNKGNSPSSSSNTSFGSLYAADQITFDQNAALSETHIFSSNLLNEFRFSFVRRELEFPENDPLSPTVTIGGLFTFGGLANWPQGRVQNNFQFSDILSWQKSKHALKFGMDVRRLRLFNNAAFNSKGTFTFDSLGTYLNNVAKTYTQALQTSTFDARQTQQFYFIQDDFRVTPNLTLNLGVRYEYTPIPFGAFGALDNESLGALVPGPVRTDKNNFGPAIGFAYSPRFENGFLGKLFGDGKSSIRGGYRLSYDQIFFNILTVTASNYPRVVTGVSDTVTDVYPNITKVSGSPKFDAKASYTNAPEKAKTPYAQSFSLSIQRDIQKDFVLEIGYAGSRGINALNQLQPNPGLLSQDQINKVLAAVAAKKSDADVLTSIDNLQLRRLYPQFGSRGLITTEAQSTYHSGFVALNKRMSHGLQFGMSYTFSKNMSNNDESLNVAGIETGSPRVPQDFFNYATEKSVSVFDRTHRFVTNYIYEIPWFKSNWAQKAGISHVFSGWQFSGVTQTQSGQPFTILTGVDSNGNGHDGGDRPMYIPGGIFNVDPVTGNLRTFTSPLVGGQYYVPLGNSGSPIPNSLGNGNLGKNTLRAPGFWNTDLSLAKKFKLFESHGLTLRVDLLNAFNQDNYGVPVTRMNSLNFGQNLNNWGNRSITLGAKYSF